MNFCFLLPGLWLTLAVFAMSGGAGIAVSMNRIRHRGNQAVFLSLCICACFSGFMMADQVLARIPGLFETLHTGTRSHFLMAALLVALAAFLKRQKPGPEYSESAIKDAAGQSLDQLANGMTGGEFRSAARLLRPLPNIRFGRLFAWTVFLITACFTLVSLRNIFPETGIVAVWLAVSGLILTAAVSAVYFPRSGENEANGLMFTAAYFLLSALLDPCLSEMDSIYGLAAYTETGPAAENIISEFLFYGASALLFLSGIRRGQTRTRRL